jgi:hypothetical protein
LLLLLGCFLFLLLPKAACHDLAVLPLSTCGPVPASALLLPLLLLLHCHPWQQHWQQLPHVV